MNEQDCLVEYYEDYGMDADQNGAYCTMPEVKEDSAYRYKVAYLFSRCKGRIDVDQILFETPEATWHFGLAPVTHGADFEDAARNLGALQ